MASQKEIKASATIAEKKKKTSWTIMLYIAADGNIANFGVESLKQLNRSVGLPPGPDDEATVVVAAQFAIGAPAGQQVPRYIFTPENGGGTVQNCFSKFLYASDDMTDQESLTSFLKWVYAQPECKTEKYALILWGHGPELLMQPPPMPTSGVANSQQKQNAMLYLSPEELRIALQEGLPKHHKLDVIGFDACSMSMFEVAYEVREHAHYMVASQEEVPDLSFPYDTLVEKFREHGHHVEELLAGAVAAYVASYASYITNSITGMKQATLSALRLEKCEALKLALHDLSSALYEAHLHRDASLAGLLLEARQSTRDFAGGLYVDLADFATNLISSITAGEAGSIPVSRTDAVTTKVPNALVAGKTKVKSACNAILNALRIDPKTKEQFILANRSADSACNGVSLYLPYCSDDQVNDITQPPVKGGVGTNGGKSFSDVLNAAQPGALMNARRQLITHTEGYYEDLELALDTSWYHFIVWQWSRILIEEMPNDLDLRYSAQQAAVNICRKDKRQKPVKLISKTS
jgi:hypothetical protein